MLRWRLLLSVVFIAALVGLVWLELTTNWYLPPLFILALLLTVVATSEVIGLLASGGHRPIGWVMYAGSLAIVASNWPPLYMPGYPADCPLGRLGWPLLTLAIATIGVFLGEMRRYERPGGVMAHLALAVFGLVYVGVLMTFVVQLRAFEGSQRGLLALVSLLVVVKMDDIGAYTVGRLIGRHKMAPVLSPGKTWEGALGGLVFAVLGSAAVFYLLAPRMLSDAGWTTSSWGWVVYGLLVGGVGMLGDLAESLFKRDMGRKDSSTWMPGFGGVLDLLDSILLAAPVAYLCWAAGLVGR